MCLRYVIVCRFSLSLSLTFSTNLLIARALARFTNTVEDDARLAPGEKDRGNRARDKFSFMHSRLVSWRVRLSDYRLSATASDLLLPREIHGRTTVLKQGRSRVIVSRFTTESIISICPSAYHRRLYHTTISYFAKYTGTNVSLSARYSPRPIFLESRRQTKIFAKYFYDFCVGCNYNINKMLRSLFASK